MIAAATSLLVLLLGAAPAAADAERRVARDLPEKLARVVVHHSLGDLIVRTLADGEKARAELVLVASGANAASAKDFLDRVELSTELEGDGAATLRTLFPEPKTKMSYAAALTLWLPRTTALALESRDGKVVVADRDADVSITNQMGAVEVSNVHGRVTVEDQFDHVTLRDVTGDAIVRCKSCSITATRVNGRLEAHTNGNSVHVEQVGSLFVENRLGPIEVSGCEREATLVAPFCSVSVHGVGGALGIESNGGSVTVDGVGGDLKIEDRLAKSIEVRHVKGGATVHGNLSPVLVEDVDGRVEVRSPSAPVKVRRVGGPVEIENSAARLELFDARGGGSATTSGGGILQARFAKLPAIPAADAQPPAPPPAFTLEAQGGEIEIELPQDASCTLEGTSTTGQIDCDFPDATFESRGNAKTVKLKLGEGKATLHATCVGGALHVRRAGAP